MPQVAWVGNLIPVLLSQSVHNMHNVSFLISHGLSSSLLQLVPSSTSAHPSSSFLSPSLIQTFFPSFSEKHFWSACLQKFAGYSNELPRLWIGGDSIALPATAADPITAEKDSLLFQVEKSGGLDDFGKFALNWIFTPWILRT